MIHVSVDGGQVWNVAQLPSVNHEQFYSILAATRDMIFMHVDDPGGGNAVATATVLLASSSTDALRSFYLVLV